MAYKHPGHVLTLVAPTGGVAGGVAYQIGGLFVVAMATAAVGVDFPAKVDGVFELPKVAGVAWAEGQALYWVDADGEASTDSGAGPFCGVASAVALSAATEGRIALKGGSSDGAAVLQVRKRFTIAEANAGATILPALPGRKYRMVDAIAIAIGGAATAVTTVDILGTQTTSKKLAAYAQASLTQSTVLHAGESGAAVLADGASFVANDADTAVTIGVTGSDIATATHVDVILSYAVDV